METFLEKLYKLGLIKHRVVLSDRRQISLLKKEFPYIAEKTDRKTNGVNFKNIISKYFDEDTYNFISSHADLYSVKTHVFFTNNNFTIEQISKKNCEAIINLNRINDIRRINKFLELVNEKLPQNGVFVGCCETLVLRQKKLLEKYPIIINRIILAIDYVFKRVFPKLPVSKKIYFKLTGGRNRVISLAETLGRIYSCGFEVVEEKTIGNLHFFSVRKKSAPAYDSHPSYGLLFPMVRTGKNGKTIRVYKVRTMFPFSEYLQAYIYEKNNLDKGGKFNNDFRITAIGKFMRKFWIDELPMIYNLLKGDLKLVGIRPLSKQFQSLYPEDLLELRHKFRPGLVPPYYADMPKGINEIVDSERRYLQSYQKSPLKTDWKYFWRAFVNIVFRNARSK